MCPIEKFPESELAKISFIPLSLEFSNYSFEKPESCAQEKNFSDKFISNYQKS